jgi:hypothetical protein
MGEFSAGYESKRYRSEKCVKEVPKSGNAKVVKVCESVTSSAPCGAWPLREAKPITPPYE